MGPTPGNNQIKQQKRRKKATSVSDVAQAKLANVILEKFNNVLFLFRCIRVQRAIPFVTKTFFGSFCGIDVVKIKLTPRTHKEIALYFSIWRSYFIREIINHQHLAKPFKNLFFVGNILSAAFSYISCLVNILYMFLVVPCYFFLYIPED